MKIAPLFAWLALHRFDAESHFLSVCNQSVSVDAETKDGAGVTLRSDQGSALSALSAHLGSCLPLGLAASFECWRLPSLFATGDTYTAHAAVLTLPLGVLKQKVTCCCLIAKLVLTDFPCSKQSVSFSPELPAWKRDSIDKLGVAVINKVVLRFPNRFWEVRYELCCGLEPVAARNRRDREITSIVWSVVACGLRCAVAATC